MNQLNTYKHIHLLTITSPLIRRETEARVTGAFNGYSRVSADVLTWVVYFTPD